LTKVGTCFQKELYTPPFGGQSTYTVLQYPIRRGGYLSSELESENCSKKNWVIPDSRIEDIHSMGDQN